jgi:hypothetical protein
MRFIHIFIIALTRPFIEARALHHGLNMADEIGIFTEWTFSLLDKLLNQDISLAQLEREQHKFSESVKFGYKIS